MDIHVITLWWLGYPWYIYVIDCVNIPEGSWALDPLWCDRRHGPHGFRSSRSRRTAPVPPCRSDWKADWSGEVKIWKVYAKYNYGISVWYTHRQTEGHPPAKIVCQSLAKISMCNDEYVDRIWQTFKRYSAVIHNIHYMAWFIPVISYIGSYIWDMTWLWLGYTGLIFYTSHILYI